MDFSVAPASGAGHRGIVSKVKGRPRPWPGVKAGPVEIRRRTKDGRTLDVLLTVTTLHDEKGRPVEFATTERDITALKRAERELRRLHVRVISVPETERQRLARELHDGVGQILSGVKFRLEALPGEIPLHGAAEDKIRKVGGLFSLMSKPGAGTSLSVRAPLEAKGGAA